MAKVKQQVKCPVCGGKILIGQKNFYCEAYRPTGDPDDCDFILWKSDLEKLGKPEISESEALKLIGNETIFLKLVNKAGKKFECEGRLSQMDCTDGKKRWKVQLVFPENESDRVLGEE